MSAHARRALAPHEYLMFLFSFQHMVEVTMSRVSLLLVCLLLGYASSDGHGHYPSSLHYPTSHINSHYPTDHHGGSHLVDAVDILFSNSGIQ